MFDLAGRNASYRRESEDRAAVFSLQGVSVVAIADGAGGRRGGAAAAEIFMDTMQKGLPRCTEPLNPFFWCKVLQRADARICDAASAGETTGVVVAVSPQGLAGASVGDSQAWIVENADIRLLTAHQVEKPFLGCGCAQPVPFHCRASSGTLLVATDGLFKYADSEAIGEALRRAQNAQDGAEALLRLLRSRRPVLPDDVALVVCRLA